MWARISAGHWVQAPPPPERILAPPRALISILSSSSQVADLVLVDDAALRAAIAPHVGALVEPLFAGGLSPQLIRTLQAISRALPAQRARIGALLLREVLLHCAH